MPSGLSQKSPRPGGPKALKAIKARDKKNQKKEREVDCNTINRIIIKIEIAETVI